MLRKALALGLLTAVAASACTDSGNLKNPFAKEAPFAPSAVPDDFAVVIDENHDTFYARQHIHQVITVAEARSKTEYTTFRDYNNTVSNNFSQETPLSPVQLQNMWNDVVRYNLLDRSTIWINWLSDADLYKRDTTTVQIRANGKTRSYRQTNGFPGALRPLMLEVNAVRLPLSQNSSTPVISNRPVPSSQPVPESLPALVPTTQQTVETPSMLPAATEPAK